MDELDPRLLGRLREAAHLVPQDMRPLVFGSAATDFGMARDIDILLVYPAGDVLRAHETAALLRNQSPDFDVLALSVEELEGVAFAEPEHDLRALPIEWHW